MNKSLDFDSELRTVAEVCERAAGGDLEARLTGLRADGDFGRVCRAINHLLDVADSYVRESAAAMDHCSRGLYHRPILLRGLPGSYRDAALVINGAAQKMQADALRIGKFEVERRAVAARVQETTDAVSHSAGTLNGTAAHILENAERTKSLSASVSESAQQTAESAGAVAAACEELTATVGEISRRTRESAEVTHSAVSQAETAGHAVLELGDAARKIQSVVDLINKIARQTNLLALNATIEAARAGEHGRGFAVVAHEVKVLSQDTSKATDSIVDQMAAMRDATANVVKAIDGIHASIQRMSAHADSISKSLGEQVQATGEISGRVTSVSRNAQEISSTIGSVTEAATETERVAADLQQASGELSRHADALRGEVRGLSADAPVTAKAA